MTDSSCSAVVGLGRVRLGVGSVAALTAALTAALLMWSPSPAGAVAGYGDVATGDYFAEPVQWSVDNSVSGVDVPCFAPDRRVTRVEAASWIWRMQGEPAAPAHSFSDVGASGAVSWMVDNKITTGTTPTTFSPNDTLTRAQLAAFLWRLADQPAAPSHSFSDVHAGWQQGPVSWMLDRGITTGTTPTTFSPDNPSTRAQLATFLYRYNNKPAVTIDNDTPTCSGTFKTVSVGEYYSCAIRADDTIACWGWTTAGGGLMHRRARS